MLDTEADLIKRNKQEEYQKLDLILKTISSYRQGLSDLGDVSISLEMLLHNLEEADNSWREEYWEHLETLIIQYGYFVKDGKVQLSEKDSSRVDDALNGIEQLVKEQIKQYEPYLDDAEYE